MLVGADAILVLERGKVYDIGTHDDLVRRCDIYKQMWFQQNRPLNTGKSNDGFIVPQGA
jgi:ATP-binding cassette subfamily B protein